MTHILEYLVELGEGGHLSPPEVGEHSDEHRVPGRVGRPHPEKTRVEVFVGQTGCHRLWRDLVRGKGAKV